MEQLIYVKSVTLNFNLRKPHSKRPTNLYAVVKLSGKQIKIPTTAKICAYLWNSKKQLPVLCENMSEIDKNNALSVNNIIFLFQKAFTEFYLYLCSRKEVITPNEAKDYFIEKVLSELKVSKDMAKNGVPNVKRERSATKALLEALKLYSNQQVASSTIKTYRYNLQNFLDYCKSIPRDSIRMLTDDGMKDYENYLRNQKKSADNSSDQLRSVFLIIF